MSEQLLTVAEVAERLKVSPSKIRTKCRRRQWPHYRIDSCIRFSEKHITTILRKIELLEDGAKPVRIIEPVAGNHFRIRARSAS